MRKDKGRIVLKIKIIALVLAFATLLGAFSGCKSLINTALGIKPSDNDTSYIVKRLEENGYTETVYPRVSASTMRFTLSEENMDEFYKKVEQCEEIYRGGSPLDKKKLKKLLYETNSYLEFIRAQYDIAYMLYYSDMRDEQAMEDYNYAYECCLDASRVFFDFMWLWKNENNHLADTLKQFDKDEIGLVSVESNIDEVRKNRQSIITKYNSIESPGDESVKDEVYEIYEEYVKNAYDLAKAYGYKNYYEYVCDGDYTAKDREAFREYVKKYIVPLCIEYRNGYKAYDETLSEEEYNLSLALDGADYRLFGSELFYDYFDSFGDKVGATMKEMLTDDKIFRGKADGGYDQAFNHTVGNTKLCYFPNTLAIDEMVFQSACYCGSILHGEISGELKTLYGYSNMLVFTAYLEGKVDEKAQNSYAYYRIYEHLYQIISATVRDEFDEIIFNNSNPGNISLAEMDRYMELLIKEYRAAEYGGEKCVNQLKTYWSRRGISDSCDNFRSAVSMCAALDIYAEATIDYNAAAKTFCFIMENIYSKRDFIGTMSRAGINSPFREEFYTVVTERLAWKGID